jgi:hypothetical protein
MGSTAFRERSGTNETDTEIFRGRADTEMNRGRADTELVRGRSDTY